MYSELPGMSMDYQAWPGRKLNPGSQIPWGRHEHLEVKLKCF
jgi:hypothetical protein